MTIIPMWSLTFHGPRGIHVELFDSEHDAVERRAQLGDADAMIQTHQLRVGRA